jgi:hypothetical protein
MTLPTEPIGSIPRPLELIQALTRRDADDPSLEPLYEDAGARHCEAIRGDGLSGDH